MKFEPFKKEKRELYVPDFLINYKMLDKLKEKEETDLLFLIRKNYYYEETDNFVDIFVRVKGTKSQGYHTYTIVGFWDEEEFNLVELEDIKKVEVGAYEKLLRDLAPFRFFNFSDFINEEQVGLHVAGYPYRKHLIQGWEEIVYADDEE